MLFVRSYFVWAEIILIVNFFNLSSLYSRHNTNPRFIHIPATSGPLAWTFVALYWNGAIAARAEGLAARIVANIFIWGILAYGFFFLVAYKVCTNITWSLQQLTSYRTTPLASLSVSWLRPSALDNSPPRLLLSNGSLPSSLWEFSLSLLS